MPDDKTACRDQSSFQSRLSRGNVCLSDTVCHGPTSGDNRRLSTHGQVLYDLPATETPLFETRSSLQIAQLNESNEMQGGAESPSGGSSGISLSRQTRGRVKLRGRKPSLNATDVLPLVQKPLYDRLRIVGVEPRLAFVPLEHMEHVGVVLVLLACYCHSRRSVNAVTEYLPCRYSNTLCLVRPARGALFPHRQRPARRQTLGKHGWCHRPQSPRLRVFC